MSGRQQSQFAADYIHFRKGNYKCWRPRLSSTEEFDDGIYSLGNFPADYNRIPRICRTLHFGDYQDVLEDGLQALEIDNYHLTVLSSVLSKPTGLFFGLFTDEDDYHWYGNVCLTLDLNDFLATFQPRRYFVDMVDFKHSSLSRLLLTDYNYDGYLQNYYASNKGGPWFRSKRGINWYLDDTRRFGTSARNADGHSVEFIIDLEPSNYEELWSMCEVVPVDHSQANTNVPMSCFHYNSQGETCPSPWSKEQTNNII